MAVETQPETLRYILVITRRGASEVLISTGESSWSLASVGVPRGERLAEQVVRLVRKRHALDSYCLWSNHSPLGSNGAPVNPYAVLETVGCDDLPLGPSWIRLPESVSYPALRQSDQAVLRHVLEELKLHAATPDAYPFARPGWIDDLFAWVELQIQPLHLTGHFQQLNASPTFSLIRIETTAAAVWFKATGEPNAHERDVTVTLNHLFPDFLPRIVGVHPTWNGWLAEEGRGRTLDRATDIDEWAAVARSLAQMQIASRRETHALLESGCRDLRLGYLAGQIAPFLKRMVEVMATQPAKPPETLDHSEISELGGCLNDTFAELEQCGWPDTLGHLDPNPRNILVSEHGCRFLDWAEGSVGHPLFTFEYLREHARRNLVPSDAISEKFLTAYAGPWQSFISPDVLTLSLEISPLLAVFACAVADARWRSPESLRNRSVAGYFRSLTRRAYREAVNLVARRSRCPA
jgi:hypothetical protein